MRLRRLSFLPPPFCTEMRHFEGAGYGNKMAELQLLKSQRLFIAPATEKFHRV